MKRVLFLARLFEPHIGGVETHVLNVSKQLVKKGYEVTVLTQQYERNLPLQQTLQSVKVVRIPFGFGEDKLRLWGWIWQHSKLFTQSDVIHVHDVFWWILPVLPFIHKKYFITFHGWEGTFPIKKRSILQRQLAAKLAQGVIQIGEYIGRWYHTRADRTLYGAVKPTQLTRIMSKPEYEFAFVGRLDQDNDVQKVVKLFQLIRAEKPSAKFIFVGDGSLRKQCEELGEVTGFVSNLEQYLVNSRYVCANSYLSIMESQAMGKMVFSVYSNPLKKDYLHLYPLARYMVIEQDPQRSFEHWKKSPKDIAQHWVKQQTWEKIAQEYNSIWK